MQKLVWINSNNERIDLTSGPFGITEWNGFSNADINVQSQQVPFQDGSVFLDALVGNRELSVTLAMCDGNDLERRYQLRRKLIHELNPKLGEGYLIYTNDFISKRIKCIAKIPVFPTKNSNSRGTAKASLAWTACNPYWEDLEEKEVTFDTSKFPVIKNEGDVPAQMEIDFFTNNVKNPSIVRMNGEKKISYKGTLNNSLYINTKFGQKQVYSEDLKFNISEFHGNINSICYAADLGMFVAVSQGVIFYSYDAVNWKIVSVDVASEIYSVCYSSELNLFVAVGLNGIILTSPDGINWTQQSSGGAVNLTSICYSSELNLFVAVVWNGTILTSSDGINWTQQSSGSADVLYSICYSSELNLFVVIGDSGTILTSPDGINWTQQSSGSVVNLTSICYSSELNLFVAVGLNGTILTSSDGINWTQQTSGVASDLRGVTYSPELNLFVAVGSSGTILYTSFFAAENQIQNITSDSDMNLNLEVGDNKFRLTKSSGNFSARIKYRQLYLGV